MASAKDILYPPLADPAPALVLVKLETQSVHI
jgi:hypothetical protein